MTGLVWSDIVSSNSNWCHASGSNNKQGSPHAEVDPWGLCSGNSQDQMNPVSVCAEDTTHLNGTDTSPYPMINEGKGGLGKLSGATTPLTWWLPSDDDFSLAYEHGAAVILPKLTSSFWSGFWTAAIDYSTDFAWYFAPASENLVYTRANLAAWPFGASVGSLFIWNVAIDSVDFARTKG